MSQGTRPNRVADQLRAEITELLAREVHDPGIGFLTITHVKVTPDLQVARVYYTTLGDEKARRDTQRALERATPFLRRHIGGRLRLKRVPDPRVLLRRSDRARRPDRTNPAGDQRRSLRRRRDESRPGAAAAETPELWTSTRGRANHDEPDDDRTALTRSCARFATSCSTGSVSS